MLRNMLMLCGSDSQVTMMVPLGRQGISNHHDDVGRSGYISGTLGAVSIRKTVLPGLAIPMLKIRRPNGRLIFNMEIAIRR